MDEESLKASIETYKAQLQQIEQAIQAAGETDDLVALRRDLKELISLTEDSLLSLKKSELLQSLDEVHGSETGQLDQQLDRKSADTSLDNEYAAFQELLGDDATQGGKLPQSDCGDNSPQRAGNSNATELSDMYKEIVGTKCRAPYTHEWGPMGYHNALIVGIDELTDLDLPKVRVMFCNPTHSSMLPCKYYLEDKCRFSDQECRNSHGSLVDLEDLKEYEDPDFSCLRVESKCLARYDEDDLWYAATVVEIGENHDVTVTFDSYDDECIIVPLEDVLPAEHDDESSDGSDEDIINQPISREESDDEDSLPVYLVKPQSHGLGDLGQWEAHTRGIGSRLMTKMGYEPGKGLGKDGAGRVDPVPIQLLPQGKSLDKIMRLKEIAGERDMFDVLKKHEKKMKKENEKREKNYTRDEKPNVFDFINKKLGGKKGKLSQLVHQHEGQGQKSHSQGGGHRHISEHELKDKSDRHLNIQLLKTNEEMKSVEKELVRLKQSLSRNENRDKKMADQIRDKIKSSESYLQRLKTSEKTMESHQMKRNNHKKLTVF